MSRKKLSRPRSSHYMALSRGAFICQQPSLAIPTARTRIPAQTQLKLADVAGKIKLKTYDRGGGRVRPALQRQVSSSSSIKLPPGLPPTAPDSEEDSDSEASSAVAAINEKGKVKKSWPMFSRRNKTRGKDVYDSSSTSQNATSSKSSGSVNLRTSVHEQKHALLNRSPSPAVPSTMNPATINGKIPSNDSGCPGSDEPGSVELNARHVSFRAPTASIYGSGEDDAAQVHDFDPATEENASEQTTESKLASLTRRYPKGSRTKSESPLKTPLPLLDQESSPYRSPDQSIKAVDFAMQPVKQIIPPLASEEEDSDDDFDRAFVRTAVRRATPAPGIHSPTPSDDERPTSSDLRAGLHEDDEQIQLPDIDLVMGDSEPASLPTPQSMADDDDDDAEDRQEISTTQSITEPQEYQTGRNVDSTAPSKSLRPVRDISPSTFTPFLPAHGQSSQIEPITEFTPSPERFKHRSVQPAQSTSDSLSSTQSKPSESEELSQAQEQSQISSQSPSTSGPSQSQAGLSSQADSLPQSMDLSRRGEELAEQYYRQRMTAEVPQKRNWFTSFTSLLTTTAKEPQSPSSQEPAVTSHTSQVDVTDSLPGPSVDVGATPALEVDMEGVDQFINWEMAEPSTAIQQPGLRGQPEDPPKVPSRDALFEVDEVRERHSAEVAALQARLLKAEAELHSTRDAMAAVVAERDAARRNLEAFTSQGHAASTSNLFASGSSGISAAALSSVDGTAELQSQLNEAQTRIAELEVTLQERERDISSLKTQIELLQSVSRKANDAAARFGREARELEEKNKILDSQVKFGVAQAHSVGEERAKHLQRDLAEAKLTIELLQQQSRLTDDTVRARAAEHPKLLQRIEDIKDQLNGRMRQIDDIGLRNRQLQDQLDEERVKSSQEQRIVFRCPWHTGRRCGEYFSTHQDLDEHVATAHVPDENAAYLASLGHLGDLDPMDISY
ncbi:hypothetical protein BKA62DRAFT_283007 [Auriculariales sp. MPI-PUGE-AT-0066]|nr:hypothetical protein BKA62DRAFT_283007 [Auriculariales sp. MPI-PUGE-AT-0066]